MRNSDEELILDWSKAFRFHLTEQDIKDTCEMLKRMVEMRQSGMEEDEILCEILMGGDER